MGRLEYEFEVQRLATSGEHLGFLHEGIIESINDDLEAFDDLKKKNVRLVWLNHKGNKITLVFDVNERAFTLYNYNVLKTIITDVLEDYLLQKIN